MRALELGVEIFFSQSWRFECLFTSDYQKLPYFFTYVYANVHKYLFWIQVDA